MKMVDLTPGFDLPDPLGWAKDGVGDAIKDGASGAIDTIADGVGKAVTHALQKIATMWVNVDSTALLKSGNASASTNPSTDATSNINTLLSYSKWIGFGVCLLALMAFGARLAWAHSHEDSGMTGRLGIILLGTVLISGSSSLVLALLQNRNNDAAGTVAFLQDSLWFYMLAAAMVSVIIGGAKMAWEQRAEPGRELLKSLLTLIVVAGSATTIVRLLLEAGDKFSEWILKESMNCQSDTGKCVSDKIVGMLFLSNLRVMAVLAIIVGIFLFLASLLQIVLMIVRTGMLIILLGILPLSAAASNTEMGKSWFTKSLSWLIAFILYKPAAAIVYAAAFKMTDAPEFKTDQGLISALTGLMMMLLAIFALPALMRFVTPMVAPAIASGVGAPSPAGQPKDLPTGAPPGGRLSGGNKQPPPPAQGQGPSGAAAGGGSRAALGSSGGASSGAAAGGAAAAAGVAGAAIAVGAAARKASAAVKQKANDSLPDGAK